MLFTTDSAGFGDTQKMGFGGKFDCVLFKDGKEKHGENED